MKELTREITKVEIYGYEAMDGTKFNTKEECEKYETTAEAVINKRFNDLIIGTENEYDLFNGIGSDEYNYSIFKIDNKEDLIKAEMYANFHKLVAKLEIGKTYYFGNFDWESEGYGCINKLSNIFDNYFNLFIKTLAKYDKEMVINSLSNLINEVAKIDTETENK